MRQADSPQESMQVETLCAATQVAASSIKNLNKSSHMLYPVPASNEHRHRLNHRNRNGYRMQRLGSGYSKSNDAVPGSFPSANSLSSNCRLDNLIPISLCASSMIAIGSLMLAGGVVVMIFDHMELGPPQFDEQYERYSGSSLSEIVGKPISGPGIFVCFRCSR